MKNLRRCLGRFATGVTIVTAADAAGHHYGITANSFSSVSLEPPLVLWNIAKSSNSLDAFLNAKHFAIHVLSERQQALSQHFAQTDHSLFDGIAVSISEDGVPLLPDVHARFECRTERVVEAGDHHIIIGEITDCVFNDSRPLLFYRGDYDQMRDDG